MKKYFKLIGIPFLIAVVIFLFIRFIWLPEFKFKDMTVDEYVNLYNSSGEGIIYVTKEDAVKKDEFEKVIGSNFYNKKIEVYKLDLTNVSGDDEQKFIDANEFTNDSFVIPMLIYIKDGNVEDSILGYAPNYIVEEFITNNNIE